jgi:hypothetical protein
MTSKRLRRRGKKKLDSDAVKPMSSTTVMMMKKRALITRM